MEVLRTVLIVASYIATAGAGVYFGFRLAEEYIRRYYK